MEFYKPQRIALNPPETPEELAIDVGSQMHAARIRSGMTQTKLAEIMKDHQPDIARAESGNSMVGLRWLLRIAKATKHNLSIKLIPKEGVPSPSYTTFNSSSGNGYATFSI